MYENVKPPLRKRVLILSKMDARLSKGLLWGEMVLDQVPNGNFKCLNGKMLPNMSSLFIFTAKEWFYFEIFTKNEKAL